MAYGVPITNGPGGAVTATRVSYSSTGTVTNPGAKFDMDPIQLGETVTISCWVFIESGLVDQFACAIASVSAGPNTTFPIGVWTRIKQTLKHTNAGIGPTLAGFRRANVGSNSGGGSFLIANAMVISGDVDSDFFDGSMPQCKWDGSVGASSSVGYPYTIGSIAGKPKFDYEGTDALSVLSNFNLNPGDPVTFYTVSDYLTLSDGSSAIQLVLYGDAPFSDTIPNSYSTFRINASTLGASRYQLRRTGAISAQTAANVNIGRHVVAHGIDASAHHHIALDWAARATDLSAPMVHATTRLQIQAPQAVAGIPATSHVRTLGYPGAHSEATTYQIRRWLANHYGTPFA